MFHIDHTVHAVTLTTNDLAKVRRLTFDACAKWESFGLELGLSPTTLEIIQKNSNDTEKNFMDMLKIWLKTKPTWENLIAALRERTMGLHDVADRVEKEHEKIKNSATDGPEDTRTGNGLPILIMFTFISVCFLISVSSSEQPLTNQGVDSHGASAKPGQYSYNACAQHGTTSIVT